MLKTRSFAVRDETPPNSKKRPILNEFSHPFIDLVDSHGVANSHCKIKNSGFE